MINIIQALGVNCEGASYMVWLATVNVGVVKEEKSAGDVPTVREYLNVFPEDLSRLPPDREIEFTIDLLLGTKTISIPLIEWQQQS